MRIALWLVCFLIMCALSLVAMSVFVMVGSLYAIVMSINWPPYTWVVCAGLGVFAVSATIIVEYDRRRNG